MKKKRKKNLQKRLNKSYQNRNTGGMINILNVPDNMDFLETKDKKRYKIDILPFNVTSNNHPDRDVYDEDDPWDYKLDVWVHKRIGPGDGNYVCLAKNYNKPCPICEEMDKLKKEEADEDDIKALKPKRRCIYNVYDHNDENVKLFDSSHYLFEKELIDEAYSQGDGEYIPFCDESEDGYSVKFRGAEEDLGGNTFVKFKSFSFEKREEEIDEEILKQAVSLDSILIIPTYEELKNVLYGIDSEKLEKEKNDKENEDINDNEEKEDEEKSKRKSKRKEENKEKSKNKTKKLNKCPHGYNFGIDFAEYDVCDDCDLFDECSEVE
jgi:hypothetical protein